MPRKKVLLPFRNESKIRPYVEAAFMAGMEPVAQSVADETATLGNAAGLMLMGGTDLNPGLYGEQARRETDDPDDERDRIEMTILAEAFQRELPVLAICRGLQLLNVHQGGTLIQHLGSELHDVTSENRGAMAHEVKIGSGTRLHQIAGVDTWRVNSRHHQAVARPGEGLRIAAYDSAGEVIEALEMPAKRFVLAVQWHPEDQLQEFPEQLKLFQSLAEAL